MSLLASDQTSAGYREDLLDEIQMVSPESCPIYSRLGDSKGTSTVHEWVEDTLATATASAVPEGATAAASSTVSKARKLNFMQIIRKTGAVSGTAQAMDPVGGKNELIYDMDKTMKSWKIEAEQQLIWGTSASGDSSAGTAREMNGLNAVITTNRVTGSAGTVALTETVFNDQLQSIWSAGTDDAQFVAYVGGFNKRRISQFATSNTRQLHMDNTKKLINSVSVYESDFGTVTINLHRYIGEKNIVLLDSTRFRKAWLRYPKKEDLQKRGDLTEYQIVGELTLEHLNERRGSFFSAFASATA
jgi:hypothetical protein